MLDPVRWYPVASSHDLPYGHVYQTLLGGQPLAIWRDSLGAVNVWEDLCPHRGVRFSIGNVLHDELRCQYHAWRFASGSGACTRIPSQPNATPGPGIRAKVWPMREQDGLVWTGVAPESEPPRLGDGAPLRAMPINRAAAEVETAVAQLPGAVFFVQPVDADRCVVRGLLAGGDLLGIDGALERLRWSLELAAC
jgi:phenylpropionate dioxygenase-like ring-hydroxylating dioxygenase large terminal subunit